MEKTVPIESQKDLDKTNNKILKLFRERKTKFLHVFKEDKHGEK